MEDLLVVLYKSGYNRFIGVCFCLRGLEFFMFCFFLMGFLNWIL